MDKLDRVSACAVGLLCLWALAILVLNPGEGDGPTDGPQRDQAVQRYVDPAFEQRLAQVKSLLAAGNLARTGTLVESLVKDYPYEGQLYLLKGDVFLRKQMPVKAMQEYRKAVDLNPDFLDKNTSVFQGKKIKKTVAEAQAVIEKALRSSALSDDLQENKKTLYYMLRKIAGSCS